MNLKEVDDTIQLILKKEHVEQIIDSLEKTGQIELATKMAGLIPKKPELEFPFELESGKKDGICEAKGCMVYVSGETKKESLKKYGHVFCGKGGEGHIGDIERARRKVEEAEKRIEKEVDKGPIVKLPTEAKPEKHEKVVQKTLISEQENETVAEPAPKIVEKHLPTLDELPDKCEDCGKFVPIGVRGFIYGKTGHIYCKDCSKKGV